MSGVGKNAAAASGIALNGRMAKLEESLGTLRRTFDEFSITRRQTTWSSAESSTKNLKETCTICLEEKSVGQIFSVDQCKHRYCYSCMNHHVEVKLLDGVMPQCPFEGCTTQLNIHSCRKFLSLKLVEMMNERLIEDSIPIEERFYCPYPRCSKLMSKKDLDEQVLSGFNKWKKDLDAQVLSGFKKWKCGECSKCHGHFCISCKVPWHTDMTCDAFTKKNPETGDAKVKSLATRKHWRQCVKCNQMIELLQGCYHITCRCGYHFCYKCGAEWRNKKPTCTCPIWDEAYIIHNQGRRQ